MLIKNELAEKRFLRLMPKTQDLSLIVLKGHLLIEEILQEIINQHLKEPDALSDARLTFFHRLRLVQALTGKTARVWKSVEKLNQIRNQLAHKLEPSDLESRIDEFIKDWAEDTFTTCSDSKERAKRLRNTLALICGYAVGYGEALISMRTN